MANHPPQSLLASASSGDIKPAPYISPEEREHHLKVARVFIEGWLEALKVGDIAFKTYRDNVHSNLQALKLDGFERQKKLGFAIDEALKIEGNKATRSRGSRRKNPLWLCRMCYELVEMASADGLPKTKETTKLSAFEKVSQLLTSYGVDICPAERVIKLCAMWRKEIGDSKSR